MQFINHDVIILTNPLAIDKRMIKVNSGMRKITENKVLQR